VFLTIERFRGIYPEFDDVTYPDAEVQYALDLAQEVHRCSANALYAVAAHFLSLFTAEKIRNDGGGASTSSVGTIKKARVGRIATEFVSMAATAADVYYEQTPYGKLYLALRNAAARKLSTRVR